MPVNLLTRCDNRVVGGWIDVQIMGEKSTMKVRAGRASGFMTELFGM